MKHIYLIRHALPDFPAGKGMCIGTTDIPLGETGFQQAARMAANLPAVTAVFSSPLSRAVQTAQAIGMPVTVVDDLREMYAGEWEGLTFDEIRQRYPELYAARAKDLTLPLPGAEDPKEGLVRFTAALQHCVATSPGDLAIVAHGGIIARFLQELTGTWYKPDYVQVIHLIWDKEAFFLLDSLQ